MSSKLQTIRGTKDLINEEALKFEFILRQAEKVFINYGYKPIYTPMIEFLEVFNRSLGDFSDVVSKEMYSFTDRGGDLITLRPEFTASIMRSFIENSMNHQLPVRLYTHGALFRYERPQKGRQRQFHQINAEFITAQSKPYQDAEIISMAYDILKILKIDDKISLKINSLGSNEDRKTYLTALTEYFEKYKNELSNDSKIRLNNNPLRILDSKDENDKRISKTAPNISSYYSDDTRRYFDNVLEHITLNDIKFEIDSNLVRGLDYYSHTSFEFATDFLGAQGTVIGGGRYDTLCKIMGGADVTGVGFGGGIERLALLIGDDFSNIRPNYIINIGESSLKDTIKISNMLRLNNINITSDIGVSASKIMKKAHKENAKFIFFVGDEELSRSSIKVRDMDSGEEYEFLIDQLIEKMKNLYEF